MITHDQIWGALDTIAKNNSISPSRTAINSGLDATTFNKYYSACTRIFVSYPNLQRAASIAKKNLTNTSVGVILAGL